MHSSRMRTAHLLPVLPGCTAPGGSAWFQGVYLVQGGTWSKGATCPFTAPVDRMTDTCKNITFANFV